VLGDIALLDLRVGDPDAGERELDQAIDWVIRGFGRNTSYASPFLCAKAKLEQSRGDVDEAERIARECVDLAVSRRPSGCCLNRLAVILWDEHDYEEAAQTLDRYLEALRRDGPPAEEAIATMHLFRARVAAKLGRRAEAQDLFDLARRERETLFGAHSEQVEDVEGKRATALIELDSAR
jgi:tetratricopeptide (TPR) repeat protein